MEFIRKTVDSASLREIFDIPLTLQHKRVDVIVLPAESYDERERQRKLKLGFVRGTSLPESFFDPLPEEELKAWGL